MGFQHGLSGLNASSKNLDVIGNNIANASTVGFKGSRAEFADIYAATFANSGTLAGIGARLDSVAQQFGQGNISTTSNPLDLAITGNGFYRVVDQAGNVSYSRNGQFQLDRSGYIVNGSQRLTGWPVDARSGLLNKGGVPQPLQLTVGNVGASATGASGLANAGLAMITNLDGSKAIIDRAAPPAGTGPLNVQDPTTYSDATTSSVYDAQGVRHSLTYYFTKTATNQWEVQTSFDGANPVPATGTAGTQAYLYFDGNGKLDTTSNPTTNAASFTYTTALAAPNGATSPFTFPVTFAKSTQFGSAFGATYTQDGYADGTLTGISVDKTGVIVGSYSNSQTKVIGQVVLANFANAQGLQPIGDNRWAETFASGAPNVGDPGTSNLGSLQSSALEDSNIDLTGELVNLITAQRNYQANAKTISAQDTILQTLVNLG
ncbi:flagellar hook protein FlgE [Jeongeupia sp. HS-3]|uniref:flagellar hook protein FlgE n=1 Tax=Jeongeupia sp. HS-3 TaxID=1009682 RepID=UPI0018A4DB87|nr:flagellar hook protein FlgE [Jeongeupia sp. HS-3]BCL75753.1 flagellar hook protein FlgE [Jeongeupia sp. HS-3]